MKGTANDATQKVVGSGQFRRVVNKTPEEIELAILPGISEGQRPAHITNEQWQNFSDRLDKLENR